MKEANYHVNFNFTIIKGILTFWILYSCLRSDNANLRVRTFTVTSPFGLLYGFYVGISFMLSSGQLLAYYNDSEFSTNAYL